MSLPEDPLLAYLLRLGDDNLIVAHRLSELVSRMPELEEDITVANLSLDHLGQARLLYSYGAEVEGAGRGEDQLAMLRDERDFLNAVLVEQPNGDFGHSMARQLFVDAYQVPLYEALVESADATIAEIAQIGAKEARYHLGHSSAWVIRLGDGTEESHRRMQAGLDALWPFTEDLFAADHVEAQLQQSGVAADLENVHQRWVTTITEVLNQATLTLPVDEYQRGGGRIGVHTKHLGHLLPEMQNLYRTHPGVSW